MVKVMSLLIKAGTGVGCMFGLRAWTEKDIWCIKGMYRLKVVSSERVLRVKRNRIFHVKIASLATVKSCVTVRPIH